VDFNYLPEYYLLPDEINDFEDLLRDKKDDTTYILKPSKGRAGRGIKLVKTIQDIPKSAYETETLVQKYIENPLLMGNKKFDARLYVMIYGVDPIVAYLCEEGLARFCTHNYQKPNG